MAERKACDVAGMTREGGGSRREAVNPRSTGFDPGALTARGKGPASKKMGGMQGPRWTGPSENQGIRV